MLQASSRDLKHLVQAIKTDTQEALGTMSESLAQLKLNERGEEERRGIEQQSAVAGRLRKEDLLTGVKPTSPVITTPGPEKEKPPPPPVRLMMHRLGFGLGRMFNQAVSALTEDSGDELATQQEGGGEGKSPISRSTTPRKKLVLDRYESRLLELCSDQRTFLEDPELDEDFDEAKRDRYEQFRLGFRVQERARDISELLENTPDVRELMVAIVPVQVSYDLFWTRYFFRESELWLEEERRRQLIRESAMYAANADEEFTWEEEEEDEAGVTMSEVDPSPTQSEAASVAPVSTKESLDVELESDPKPEKIEPEVEDDDDWVVQEEPSPPINFPAQVAASLDEVSELSAEVAPEASAEEAPQVALAEEAPDVVANVAPNAAPNVAAEGEELQIAVKPAVEKKEEGDEEEEDWGEWE